MEINIRRSDRTPTTITTSNRSFDRFIRSFCFIFSEGKLLNKWNCVVIGPEVDRNALLLVTVVPTFTDVSDAFHVSICRTNLHLFVRFASILPKNSRTTYRENSNRRGTESPSKVILEITLAACNYTLLGRVYDRLCAGTHSRFLQRACHPFLGIQAILPLAFFSFVY